MTLVEDGCATVTPQLHQASLDTLRNRYARIVAAGEAMDDIEAYVDERFREESAFPGRTSPVSRADHGTLGT